MNIIYPSILQNRMAWYFWNKTFCKKGFHLFEEVRSSWWEYGNHYLYCDACGLEIIIDDDITHTHQYQILH